MMYYDYFLNIDVSVYKNNKKEKGLMEILGIKLDCIKKIIAVFHYEKNLFKEIEPLVEEIIEK